MSWWRYRGRSLGRELHFLYHYCGLDVAEQAKADGSGGLNYRGKPFATVTWSDKFGEADVPVFVFLDDPEGRFSAAQASKREEAVRDAVMFTEVPDKAERIAVPPEFLVATIARGHRRAEFHAGCLGVAPLFWLAAERLYFQCGATVYDWNQPIAAWLHVGEDKP